MVVALNSRLKSSKEEEKNDLRGPEASAGSPSHEREGEWVNRKVDIGLNGIGNLKLPWRKAGQPRHLVDVVDSD